MNPAALVAALRGDLANALIASTPGGIERQEAEGQRTLVESNMLPKEIIGATREQLTAIGFKFGADVDELFVTCELPPGWKKRSTEHSMHSDLLDERGRRRANIFYKASFHDRRAHMKMQRRYGFECWRDGSSEQMRCASVTDCGNILKEFGEVDRYDWDGVSALEQAAKKWLTEQYPEWQNPMAYW